MRLLLPLALIIALPLAASAGVVNTPTCSADLKRASGFISSVAARDRAGLPKDTAKRCEIWRLNAKEMFDAATILDRCLTGHERTENVAHLRVSVGEVGALIAQRCR